jgi:hypothetical protein
MGIPGALVLPEKCPHVATCLVILLRAPITNVRCPYFRPHGETVLTLLTDRTRGLPIEEVV